MQYIRFGHWWHIRQDGFFIKKDTQVADEIKGIK